MELLAGLQVPSAQQKKEMANGLLHRRKQCAKHEQSPVVESEFFAEAARTCGSVIDVLCIFVEHARNISYEPRDGINAALQ
jgi:hypothetical protein